LEGFTFLFLTLMNFQLKILDKRITLQPATDFSAGYDLQAAINDPIVIRRNEKATLIPTGFALYIKDPNVCGLLLPRSGLGHKQGLVLGNNVGLLDADYSGQLYVSAWNRGQQEEIIINPLDKIAQLIFCPVIHPQFNFVDEFVNEDERGAGGFGSTGK
jgi:dUTP pyrophosphatase